MEIIKKVYNVKSLLRFRLVSKAWKSIIDSSNFINGYGAHHTHPHSFFLSYKVDNKFKYIYLVDDDNETFNVQQELPVSPLFKRYWITSVVGACHGLVCLHGYNKYNHRKMLVIWNPSVRKSFATALRSFCSMSQAQLVFGFGVCPVTKDPTIVKITYVVNMPWHVEVFTLSSGVWNVIPSGNLPRQTIRLTTSSTHVVIDRFIYWGAYDKTFNAINRMVVSFDLITKELKVVNLPDSLTNELMLHVSVSKLKGSLVVYGYIERLCCGVWVMGHDSSFRKIFTIGANFYRILGFRNNGEPVFEISEEFGPSTTLDVYNPCSQQIKNLGISGVEGSFFLDSYKESLLLLDHSDLPTHYDHI